VRDADDIIALIPRWSQASAVGPDTRYRACDGISKEVYDGDYFHRVRYSR
jgi:hypothetical protein